MLPSFSRLFGRPLLLVLLFIGGVLPTVAQAPTQKVGIGTTAPTQTLDVNGSLRVRGLNGTGNRLPVVLPDGTLGVNAPVYGTTVVAGSFPTAAAGSVGTGVVPKGVAVSGTRAYVVSLGTRLQIFDVSTPANPVLLGQTNTGGGGRNVAVSGTTAYVVTYSNTLEVFDVATPASPTLLGSVGTGSTPVSVAVSGTTAYVVNAGSNTLEVFDVAAPTSPALLGSVGTDAGPTSVAVSGTTAYVVTGNHTLQVFDVTTPGAPALVGAVATNNQPQGVAVSGTTAFVVNSPGNLLQAFDVATPASPTLLGQASTGFGPTSIAVSGTIAGVVNNAQGTLQFFDVSTPASPVLVGSAGAGSAPDVVAVSGTTACVISGNGSTLRVFALPGPPPPRTVTVNADGTFASVAPPTLSVSGQTLSISGGNTVTLPTGADNLGNHTATTNLGLNGNWLSNAPGNANGIRIDNTGNATLSGRLGIGTSLAATPTEKLQIEEGSVQLTATSPVGVGISNATSSLNLALAANNGQYTSLAQAGDAVLRTNGRRLLLVGREGGEVIVATGTANTDTERLRITNSGLVRISSLAGGGTRALTTDNLGTVTATAFPQLTLSGQTLGLSTGGSVTLPASTDNQQLTKTGSTISLTNGGSVTDTDTDNQTLSLSGQTLTISGVTGTGATVTLPVSTDNLGNHTATQNLNLGTHALVGNGGTAGLVVGAGGNVGVGVAIPTQRLDVDGGLLARAAGPISTQGAYLQWNRTGGAGETWLLNQQGGGGGGMRFGAATTANVVTEWARFEGDGRLGVGTTSPAPSAILDVTSTTKGFLPPRMSQTERNAIGSPAAGLTIYNTFTNKLNVWNGTSWDAALSATEQPFQNAGATLTYTGAPQTYTVPPGVTSITVVARGAQGGAGYNGPSATGPGGLGGQVTATLPVTPGEVLTVQVGGAGTTAGNNFSGGGYNGGGQGLRSGGGGGGASFTAPNTGGGGGYPAGAHGDNSSYTSTDGGDGGTQTAGGGVPGSGLEGTLGQGGNGNNVQSGGGGGGLYGGEGGSLAAGGGGSSGVTATGSSAVAYSNATNAGNGSVTITPGLAYAAPTLNGTNISGTWDVNGTSLYYNDGNVGIGTATPGQKLEVNGTALVNSAYDLLLRDAQHGLGWYGAGKTWNGTNPDGPVLYGYSGGVLGTRDGGARTVLAWNKDGRVGIGVPAPTQTLDVDGGILARSSSAISNQGAYLQWNRSGNEGETWLLNQRGGGGGDAGIRFGKSDGSNSVTEWARFRDDGNFGIGTTNPGQKLTVIGAICASLGVNCTSDARYKERVTTLPSALANVMKLRGVYYYWRQADFPQMQFPATRQLGFIAQEIEVLYPEMVTTDATGYKSVDYSRLTPVLVEAMKEQQAQIEVLKAQNANLQGRADRAEAATTTFEARLRALEAGQGQARK